MKEPIGIGDAAADAARVPGPSQPFPTITRAIRQPLPRSVIECMLDLPQTPAGSDHPEPSQTLIIIARLPPTDSPTDDTAIAEIIAKATKDQEVLASIANQKVADIEREARHERF
jgi:hypothetical protein